MGAMDWHTPPPEWCPAASIGGDVYVWHEPDERNPTVYHWCEPSRRWAASGTDDHEVVTADPLTLTPSLLCDTCGLHGFIRDGRWVPA